jgi:hypothetical protein
MPSIFTYLNTSLPAGTHESLKHMQNMCLPHGKHAFTSYLPHVEHAVCTCLLYSRLLFKPVVSGSSSLASH